MLNNARNLDYVMKLYKLKISLVRNEEKENVYESIVKTISEHFIGKFIISIDEEGCNDTFVWANVLFASDTKEELVKFVEKISTSSNVEIVMHPTELRLADFVEQTIF